MDALVNTAVRPIEFDKTAKKLAKKEHRALRNTGYGATIGGLQITRDYINVLLPVITTKLTAKSHKLSHDYELENVIRQLEPSVIALAALQGALHSVGVGESLRATCMLIGRLLAAECWSAKLTRHDAKLAKKIEKAVRLRHGSVSHRLTAAKSTADRAGFRVKHWSNKALVHAGGWCINRLMEAMPEVFCIAEGFQRVPHLSVTAEGERIANEAVASAVLNNPTHQPCVSPPTPWTTFHKGISEDPRVLYETALMRTHHKDIINAAAHALRTGKAKPALDGVNALQGVPFKINTWIMDVINQVYAANIEVKGLPPLLDVPEPEKISNEAFAALNDVQRELRMLKTKGIKQINREALGGRIGFNEDMETAGRMALQERFYVPMNLDWRGRVYGVSHFNFQREDRVRAMFLFADGEPIGERGLYWLKVHVANCGDFDKISKRPIEQRVQWVDDNIELLSDYVKRPLFNTGWTKADKPFLFLAAARELVGVISEGCGRVCHLPVSFDGSCSGLQHLSAMTRAPEGRYVNLTDSPEPQDVYQLVADMAKASIEADTEWPEMRKMCLDYGITRSLVKRNVMTFAYSSKVFGMAKQHLEDTMEPLRIDVLKDKLETHPFGEDEGYKASKYLAKHVHAAIVRLVQLPAQAMGFMQALARALAHESKPLRWTSPVGLPWINRYHEKTTEQIELFLQDVKVQLKVTTGASEHIIDKDKVAAGVSPNFVHALDASHLLLTVNACVAEGITSIATVHDSFGCLPSRADRFNAIIREQFLKMYTDHDVLAELLASAKGDLTEANHSKLPELPEQGALDLTEILNARYAFA
jgi:DNA-directed RNA polymerase